MKENKIIEKEYESYVKEASISLKQRHFDDAFNTIMKAVTINPNLPEPQNLLGIWYEENGNKDLARKHYRIAYVLNPRFMPASINLERVSSVFQYENIPIDYGDMDIRHENVITVERMDQKII